MVLQVFKMLVDELISMDNSSRSKFLDLVTANPRLPPGGLPQAGIKLALRTGSRTVWAQVRGRGGGGGGASRID